MRTSGIVSLLCILGVTVFLLFTIACSSSSDDDNNMGDQDNDTQETDEEQASDGDSDTADPDLEPEQSDGDNDPDEQEIESVDGDEELEPDDAEEDTELEEELKVELTLSKNDIDFGEVLNTQPVAASSVLLKNTGDLTLTVSKPYGYADKLEVFADYEDSLELAPGEFEAITVSWIPADGNVDSDITIDWHAEDQTPVSVSINVLGTVLDPSYSFAGVVLGIFEEGGENVSSPLANIEVKLEGIDSPILTNTEGRFVFSSVTLNPAVRKLSIESNTTERGYFSPYYAQIDLNEEREILVKLQNIKAEPMPVGDEPASFPISDWEGASFDLDPDNMTFPASDKNRDGETISSGVMDLEALPLDFTGNGVPLKLIYILPYGITFSEPLPVTIPNEWDLAANARVHVWLLTEEEEAAIWFDYGYMELDVAGEYWSMPEGSGLLSSGIIVFALEADTEYTISGTVYEPDGTTPANGAKVRLMLPPPSSLVETDDLGNFEFTVSATPGVQASIAAYADSILDGSYVSRSIVLTDQVDVDMGDIVLVGQEHGTILGSALYDNGQACLGCAVSAVSSGGSLQIWAPVNEDGTFNLDNVPIGNVELTLHDFEGGATDSVSVTLEADEMVFVEMSLPSTDSISPTVSLTIPGNGQTGVKLRASLRVIFSEEMNTQTFTTANVVLEADARSITGAISAEDGRMLLFTPDSNLQAGSYYTLILKTGISDLSGNGLTEEYSLTFRTIAPDDCNNHPNPPCIIEYFDWESGTCKTGNSNAGCDDGNLCTMADTCQAGVCIGGNEKQCYAADQCHEVGTCDPKDGLCTDPVKPNGDACDDGVFCTVMDSCQSGTCQGGVARDCSQEVSVLEPQCQEAYCNDDYGFCELLDTNEGNTCNDNNYCTENDTCSDGQCTGADVTCQALDQCHEVGTCDPASGLCSNPVLSDGTACDDGNTETSGDSCQAGVCMGTDCTCGGINECCDGCQPINEAGTCDDGDLCTQASSCNSGVCEGSDPVICEALDQCHEAGTCNPETGICSDPMLDNGSECDDNDACTGSDSCQSGVCTGSQPVICHALDQCHVAGICNAETGLCSNPLAAEGTSCDDGDLCTIDNICEDGVCSGGLPKACLPLDQCHEAGICNSETGVCSNPTLPDGSACDDGDNMTINDSCKAGLCLGIQIECLDDEDCPSEEQCIEGFCETVAMQHCETGCNSDADCVNGTCLQYGADINVCLQNCEVNPESCPEGSQCVDITEEEGIYACAPQADHYFCEGQSLWVEDNCGLTFIALQCEAGQTCNAEMGTCEETPCTIDEDCNDGNSCTTNTCNIQSGYCEGDILEDGISCDDGNPNTGNDSCLSGQCVGFDGCTIDDDCPEGQECGEDDYCQAISLGHCETGCNEYPCSPGHFCMQMTTDTHACLQDCTENHENCPAGSTCEIIAANEEMEFFACIPDAESYLCMENDVYINDSCGFQRPIDICNEQETCNASTGECDVTDPCETNQDCDDLNPCTVNTCEVASGLCLNGNASDGTTCDDGNPDTGDDECIHGECLGKAVCQTDEDCNEDEECIEGLCKIDLLGQCETGCSSDNDCDAGRCLQYATEGNFVCFNDCSGNPESCPEDSQCFDISGGEGPFVCIPLPVDYHCEDQDLWELDTCGFNFLALHCEDGQTCNADTASCDNDTPDCVTDDDCPTNLYSECGHYECISEECVLTAVADGTPCMESIGECLEGTCDLPNELNHCEIGCQYIGCAYGTRCYSYSGTPGICLLECYESPESCPTGTTCMEGACWPDTTSNYQCDGNNLMVEDGCEILKLDKECSNLQETCNAASGTCDLTTVCTGDQFCDDGNICTNDTCNGGSGYCVYDTETPNGTTCDDDNNQTINDSCEDGACIGQALCTVDEDCNWDEQCKDGSCQELSLGHCESGCTEGFGCQDGYQCTHLAGNYEMTCLQSCWGAPESCPANSTCDGDLCRPDVISHECQGNTLMATESCGNTYVEANCESSGQVCSSILGSCDNTECEETEDCPLNPNQCKQNICGASLICEAINLDYQPCDDGDPDTSNDTCQSGQCVGTKSCHSDEECYHLDMVCREGICVFEVN